jgi:hypothetical protein
MVRRGYNPDMAAKALQLLVVGALAFNLVAVWAVGTLSPLPPSRGQQFADLAAAFLVLGGASLICTRIWLQPTSRPK